MHASTPNVWIALGSNLGDRLAQLRCGASAIIQRLHLSTNAPPTFSSLYETAAVGGPSGQSPFFNAVIRIQTDCQPHDLLCELMSIERQAGRVRTHANGPRVLDLDILLIDQQIMETDALHVPHPRLHTRRFVLTPFCEIDPDLIHPRLGVSMQTLLAKLPGSNEEWVKVVETQQAQWWEF